MKHILIINYYWPPYSGSGVQRWLKFSKYLPEFGFKPHIYTPENPHYSITDESLLNEVHADVAVIRKPIWEPYSIADFIMGKKQSNKGLIAGKEKGFKTNMLNKIRANFFIPDPRRFWIGPSVKFLKKYIAENKIDYVVSTGPPHSMHLIALKLKAIFPNIHWTVDIRDPWSRFDFLKDYGSTASSINKQEVLEKKVLEGADLVIATSVQMKSLLTDFDSTKFHCITNGFDAEDFKDYKDDSSSDRIRIYHAGLINQLRNPLPLWHALENLCVKNTVLNEQILLHLAGTVDQRVIDDINKHEVLSDKLIVESYKRHKEVIEDYGHADVLLLLVNNSDNAAGNIPGKLFEYLATGKNILLISEPGTDAAHILENNARSLRLGYGELTPDELFALEVFLLNSKEEREMMSPAVMQYERKNLTKELVNLLSENK